jgi:hypothetical protein
MSSDGAASESSGGDALLSIRVIGGMLIEPPPMSLIGTRLLECPAELIIDPAAGVGAGGLALVAGCLGGGDSGDGARASCLTAVTARLLGSSGPTSGDSTRVGVVLGDATRLLGPADHEPEPRPARFLGGSGGFSLWGRPRSASPIAACSAAAEVIGCGDGDGDGDGDGEGSADGSADEPSGFSSSLVAGALGLASTLEADVWDG